MKKLKIRRSVIPVYLIAAVWFVGGIILRVHKPLGYVVLALISAAVFLGARKLFPDRKIVVNVPDPGEEPEPEPEPAPEDPEITALREERDRAISEMRRLNGSIQDPLLSRQIDRIETTTAQIFAYVMEHPEQKGQIRRFLNYYLPTTIKLLNAYDRMDSAGVSGTNIDGAKGKISDLMSTIVSAFDRQLDALFAHEALDIDAEIRVLESVLTSDGLAEDGSGFQQTQS